MGSKDSGDKAWVCTSCNCSSTRYVSISGKLLSWKSSLVRKFRDVLGCPQSSDLSSLGRPETASTGPMDSNVSEESPSGQEDSDFTIYCLDPSMIEGILLGQQDTESTIYSLDSNSTESRASRRRVYKYDVFLSFRGTDTRNNFTDHLCNHLIKKGIFTFKDDKILEQGQPISSQLLRAIKDSRVSIVVFSRDYAGSTWCLEEMAAIADCHQELKQTVFPVFYDVDPSHVRKQNGVYEDAFVLHAEKFKQDPGKVDRWRRAMTGLANSVGWDVRDKSEFQEIEKIVQEVIKVLGHKFSGFADDLIGIQRRVEKLEKILKLSSANDNFRVLGIWGMGGVGKTTHASVLYDRISYQFDACCFIEDVSKNYRDGGAIAVQKQILRQTMDEKNLDTYSPSEISGIITNRLHNIKVLIVLDNVDHLEQLHKLAINPKLLHTESRMIITSRDEHILKVYGANKVCEILVLNNDDAHDLLCKKAFKSDDYSNNFEMLIPKVLQYAQGLPLAIKIIGCFLCTRDATQWRFALNRLGEEPYNEIMDVLQISFEDLQSKEKEIFLHIACFFHGEREDYVKRVLDCCGLYPHIGIPIIMEKSLITIRDQEIHMHEMLRQLGKKIVRDKYRREPRLWSRLWLYQDFFKVLRSEMETNNVQAIVLDQKVDVPESNQLRLRVEGLSKMRGLQLLVLYHKNFTGSLTFLSDNLQYLLWHGYPFSSLPLHFEPYSLVELNLPSSSIKQLCKDPENFRFHRLERVDLSNSKEFIETPSFEWCPSLKRLDFSGCINLLHVHPSIGHLAELVYLSLRNCSSLVCLNLGNECKLISLKVLHLSGCTNLENTPDFTGLSKLEYLDLEQCTSLSTVHESIGALANLKFLSLIGCIDLVEIPNNINNMTSLQTLELRGCLKLINLPLRQAIMPSSCLESLIFVDLGFCGLIEIPEAIGQLRWLERLNLEENCFSHVPDTIERLSNLAYLNLAHCYRLSRLPELPFDSASSGGRYFKTVSTSRNHRSGLYIFNCNKAMESDWMQVALSWLTRLIEQPCHFRCGFDIITPMNGSEIPRWYFNHQFEGGSIIRIANSDVSDAWLGFAFCVVFEVNKNRPATSGSSSRLPCPLYLSFESENTEERFDLPPCLHMDKEHVGPISRYCWVIYISRAHCHFVKTGAHIAFKACPGLEMKKWGLRMVSKQDVEVTRTELRGSFIEDVCESSNSSGPKIQLPYNWLVTEEEEKENMDAKAKENNLYNLGHSIEEEEDENMKAKAKAKESNFSNVF